MRNVVVFVLNAVPRGHFQYDYLVRPEAQPESALGLVDAGLVVGDVRVLKRGLVDVENGVDRVLRDVVVRVEYVVIVAVRSDFMRGLHVVLALLQIVHVLANVARLNVDVEQDLPVVALQKPRFETALVRLLLCVVYSVSAMLDSVVQNNPGNAPFLSGLIGPPVILVEF